jgi:hypothetical protein
MVARDRVVRLVEHDAMRVGQLGHQVDQRVDRADLDQLVGLERIAVGDNAMVDPEGVECLGRPQKDLDAMADEPSVEALLTAPACM